MLFDPAKVPFSMRESFHAVSRLVDGFWLRSLRGGDEHTDLGRLLRLETPGGWSLAPEAMRAGGLTLVWDGPDRLLIEGEGPLRLVAAPSRYDYAQAIPGGVHILNARQDLRMDIRVREGVVALSAPWDGVSAQEIAVEITPAPRLALAVEIYRVTPSGAQARPLAEARAARAAEFAAFRAAFPAQGEAADLAAYILWSNYVPAGGVLTRPAVYMSKNWMTNIWSWDHCFVALALPPDLAWDQMAVIFEAQHPSGRLPDYLNDRYALWAFTKPPVHGWTFAQLLQGGAERQAEGPVDLLPFRSAEAQAEADPAFGPGAAPKDDLRGAWLGRAQKAPAQGQAGASQIGFGPICEERMRQVLRWLTLQADSWLSGPSWNGLPAYRHGNDAGWDNATPFAEGAPLVTPDLATFLILQLQEIARLQAALGLDPAPSLARAEALTEALLAHLWAGEGFIARHLDGRPVTTGQSLLLNLPLLLGPRLPQAMRQRLIARLADHLTDWGLATEAPTSALYRANGYWRGPIWAPTTALFIDALDRCGEGRMADDIARRFLRLCEAFGMAENFDALTGEGLHDPAFAWTSATYLRLAARMTSR